MKKRILVFNGHARATYRWGLFGEIIKRLLENPDNEVFYMDCNGSISTPCGFNAKKHVGYCYYCNRPCIKILKHINFDEKHILKMKKQPAQKFSDLSDIQSAIDFNYDGYNYGLGPVSTVMTLTRDYAFDVKKWQKYIKKFFQTEFTVFKNLDFFHSLYNFDEIHTFNGRVPVMYPCVEFARKNNLKYVVYEVGSKVNKLRIIENSVPHDFYNLKNEIKYLWEKNAPDREELAEKWFVERRKGMFQAFDSFTKDQQKDLLPAGFDNTKENFAYFNSSIDEVMAFDSWKHPFAKTENEIIRAMLERYKNDENKRFYLRVHPNLTRAKKKNTTQMRELYELKNEYKNLILIEPDAKIDTYALIEACDKVLVSYSTVGAEATYWGKAAILAGKAPYEDYNTTYQANSLEEFFEYIETKDLEPKPKESAYPYAYYCETFGDECRYYTTDSRKNGSFLGMKLASR